MPLAATAHSEWSKPARVRHQSPDYGDSTNRAIEKETKESAVIFIYERVRKSGQEAPVDLAPLLYRREYLASKSHARTRREPPHPGSVRFGLERRARFFRT